jgi:hypothetical protein
MITAMIPTTTMISIMVKALRERGVRSAECGMKRRRVLLDFGPWTLDFGRREFH